MQLKPVGYFSKPHGLKGHLVLFTQLDFTEKLSVFFVEQKGSQAPYFIEEIKSHANGFLVKLEGVNDVNAANPLKNKEVLAEEKYVIEEESFGYINYTLIDQLKGEIGKIEGLDGNPNNPLLRVLSGKKEILLPFNEDFIIKINKSKKQLLYKAPEGLIDLYLDL